MANMANIVDFNNSDGIPPDVIKKLNNNMFELAQKITSPEIVMTAGVEFPDPRTDETLFYKTDTGDLYIWGEAYDSSIADTIWTWVRIDIGMVHEEDGPPNNRINEIVWLDTSDNTLYFYCTSEDGDPSFTGWYTITDIANHVLSFKSKASWLSCPGFVEAVKDIHANPNNY